MAATPSPAKPAAKKTTKASSNLNVLLGKLGISRRFDLVLHLPLRYEDETRLTPLRDAREGVATQIEATVLSCEAKYKPRPNLIVQLEDGGELLYVRFLHFYPGQPKHFLPGKRMRLFGEIRPGFFGAEMVHPRYRLVAPEEPLPSALTPIYPTTNGLQQSALRKLIARALTDTELTDTLPAALLSRHGLLPFRDAVTLIHNPPPEVPQTALDERAHPAWRRLKFDELLAQQLALRLAREGRQRDQAPALAPPGTLTAQLEAVLPFQLTGAQHRVIGEVARDLGAFKPMQRLVQGDVGSGKTMVAAFAALQAIENGYQVAFMAPTEILAEQHFSKLSALLAPLGVTIAWLTGSLKAKEKARVQQLIAAGEAQLAIGTHALFQEGVSFAKLGLVIVDEQHRFGVKQRLRLSEKGAGESLADLGADSAASVASVASAGNKRFPHQLMMTATPIPRTLSMTYMADLDVSVIDELPPGRTPIQTRLKSDAKRSEVLQRVQEAIGQGTQIYWVCPLIEESEKLQLVTAEATLIALQATLPAARIGLVHGRLKTAEKAAVMQQFKDHALDILVATTVIEVGVDVPNAALMVIEHAERMGLSQLHQLRGRVGRGSKASECVLLFAEPLSQTARSRLKTIYETTDGFAIARADLKIRGPGEFLGPRQSGIPGLRFADLEQDTDLIEAARNEAAQLLAEQSPVVWRHLARWVADRDNFMKA